MYRAVDAIEVRVWNRTAGAVALDPRLGCYAFEYDPRFVRSGMELAPLHMPLRLATEPFVFPNLSEQTYLRLPAMLADSLPDRFGNALVTAWLEREGVRAEDITPLDRLGLHGTAGFRRARVQASPWSAPAARRDSAGTVRTGRDRAVGAAG